jgi:hypothetical protein
LAHHKFYELNNKNKETAMTIKKTLMVFVLVMFGLVAINSIPAIAEDSESEIDQFAEIDDVLQEDSGDSISSTSSLWKECSVQRCGPAEDGNVYIALKALDGTFSHWFKADPNTRDRMLNTALVALETNKIVSVNLSSTAAYSWIYRLYVIR